MEEENAYDLPGNARFEAVEGRSDPVVTEDGHRIVGTRQIMEAGAVTYRIWECVVCGMSHLPSFRSPSPKDPPKRLRTDCQTALVRSVLDS